MSASNFLDGFDQLPWIRRIDDVETFPCKMHDLGMRALHSLGDNAAQVGLIRLDRIISDPKSLDSTKSVFGIDDVLFQKFVG